MFLKVFNRRYYLLFVFVVLLSILVPFISAPHFLQYKYAAVADFFPPLNNESIFFNDLFIYQSFRGGGSDTGYLIAKLFPELALFFTLGILGLNASVISLAYISFIILLSELSMFYFLIYVFTNKFNIDSNRKYFFATIGSIIYTFSPHFIADIFPGHFPLLILYAFFPLLLYFFDKNLHKNKINFKMFLEYFVVFLLCATAFSNIGFIYVLMLTFGIISLLYILVEKTPIINILKGLIIMFSALITSNIFWILSFIDSFGQLTNLSPETLKALDNQVGLSVTKASIANILFGRAEWQMYLLKSDYYVNNLFLFIFILISVFFIITILKQYKNKFVIISLAMVLFAVFICKGPREPFGNLFMWLYHNLFGFQVFRRPLSKYHGIFLLFYLTLSLIGIFLTTLKLTKQKFFFFVVIPICLISVYLIFIFTKSFLLVPFNIPDYYIEAKNYLIRQNVKKVLILPGLHALQPTYNESINNLYATDFLYSLWPFPFDTPIGTDSAPDYHKNIINPIIIKIRNNEDICELTKTAGISHIMVRQDLSPQNLFEDKPEDLLKLINAMPQIQEKKEFFDKKYKGFTLYKIDEQCSANFIQLNDNARSSIVNFQIINPTKIKVSITNLKDTAVLKFLNNYNSTWKLYISKHQRGFFIKDQPINVNTYPEKKVFFEGDEFKYLMEKPLFDESHSISDNWANKWKIDPKSVKKNLSESYYQNNSDGSIDIQLVLYYKNQSLLYLGLAIFTFVILTIIVNSLLKSSFINNSFFKK